MVFLKIKLVPYNKILNKIEKIHSRQSFYENLVVEWSDDNILNEKISDKKIIIGMYSDKNLNFEEWMMSVDFNTYLPDDILCKVDRSSMLFSLEARSPFLNKDLIEFVYNLPFEFKINNQITKWSSKNIREIFT